MHSLPLQNSILDLPRFQAETSHAGRQWQFLCLLQERARKSSAEVGRTTPYRAGLQGRIPMELRDTMRPVP
jgi:hypothetical protein